MVKKIERKDILQDSDVIKVWSERDISINNDNLPAADNLPVSEAAANSIFRGINAYCTIWVGGCGRV